MPSDLVRQPAQLTLAPEVRDRLRHEIEKLWRNLESEHSRRAYREDWSRWCAWLTTQSLHPLTARPWHVSDYVDQLAVNGKAKSTRARALSVIRQTYGALVVGGLLETNPAREVRNLKISTNPKTPWVPPADLQQLLAPPPPAAAWIEQRDWLITLTLFGTGLRRAEAARLRWEDLFTLPDGRLAVTGRVKGNREATTVLPSWLADLVLGWRGAKREGPIFPRDARSAICVGPSTVRNAVKRVAANAGVDLRQVTPHALRRTLATIASERGVAITAVQKQLHHKDQRTTSRYDRSAEIPQEAPGERLGDLIKR